jgi:DNA-binding response OmpR family regulator
MTIRPILIVDDEAAVRDIVQQVLTLEGFVVFEAANGRAGVQAWEQRDPQLIILDIMMPKMNGLEALAHIRQHSDTPVVMLTRKASEDDKVRAFELGADDYLCKPFSGRELVVRVKAVLRRTRGQLPSAAPSAARPELSAGDLQLELDNRRVTIGRQSVVLSRTEFQILAELARLPGHVFSHAQLLTAVWGPEYADEAQLLRCAVYRLRQKLEPDPYQPTYLRGARDAGYWLATSAEAVA